MDFSETLNNFLVTLRNENAFSNDDYQKIKSYLISNVAVWRSKGSVPAERVVDVVFLIDQLAGGSRFFDEETSIKVENACIGGGIFWTSVKH